MEAANYNFMTFEQFCFANWKALQASGALNLELFPIADFFWIIFQNSCQFGVIISANAHIAMARFWSIFAFTVTELLKFFVSCFPKPSCYKPTQYYIKSESAAQILQMIIKKTGQEII